MSELDNLNQALSWSNVSIKVCGQEVGSIKGLQPQDLPTHIILDKQHILLTKYMFGIGLRLPRKIKKKFDNKYKRLEYFHEWRKRKIDNLTKQKNNA